MGGLGDKKRIGSHSHLIGLLFLIQSAGGERV